MKGQEEFILQTIQVGLCRGFQQLLKVDRGSVDKLGFYLKC